MNKVNIQTNNTSSDIQPDKVLKRLDKIAWYLDQSIRLPGGFRVGLDGVVGLVPGVGDVSTFFISSYIVIEARRLGAPLSLIFKMMWNIGIETVIGIIPLFGDLFDFYYKANVRNVKLLREWLLK